MSGDEAPVVELTPLEMGRAAYVGSMRQIQALGCGQRCGSDGTMDWQYHINGALGELAFCKWAGIYWTGAAGRREPDTLPAEIRTRSEGWHDLRLHANDDSGRPYVLVTGLNGRYRLRGWIYGVDGKREEFWGDPNGRGPAYFVPQSALRPMSELPLRVEREETLEGDVLREQA